MRLEDEHISQVRRIAKDIYGNEVRVFLFGSRVNDDARGGDIDLLIESPQKEKMNFENKIKFLTDLKLAIGDQKIDVVYNKDVHRKTLKDSSKGSDIVTTALNTGVEL